jgi:hypothetical protein
MASKSKTKGKNGERELCKLFASVFGGSWQRVFTSGAFTGGANRFRAKILSESQLLNNTNDIVPPDEYPNCAIESKAYKDFEFHHLYRKDGNKTLNKWIDQVYESGINMDTSFPMVCFKPDRQGWFVCVWKEKISDLKYTNLNHTIFNYKDIQYVVFELNTFITTFTEELKEKFSNK